MKKVLTKSAAVLAITSAFATSQLSLNACGPISDWFADHQDEVLELQAFAIEDFELILKSLSDMYSQNPNAFVQFVTLWLQGSGSQIPSDLLVVLKQFKLVADDAQISDLVRLVISWAVEQKVDGTVKIWSLQELIKDGWVTVR